MNRPIKFRVWDKLNKKMIVDEDNLLISLSGDVVKVWDDGEWANTINGLNYILMQSTGLKDKNGKEIWEGDVLNHDKYSKEFKEGDVEIVKVETLQQFFEDRGLYTREYGEEWDAENFEIIGNIYENKELIK